MKNEEILDVLIKLIGSNKKIGICDSCDVYMLIEFKDGKPLQEKCECGRPWRFTTNNKSE